MCFRFRWTALRDRADNGRRSRATRFPGRGASYPVSDKTAREEHTVSDSPDPNLPNAEGAWAQQAEARLGDRRLREEIDRGLSYGL